MKLDRNTRLPRDQYANRDTTFHVTVSAHPEVASFGRAVMESIWTALFSERQRPSIQLLGACLMPDHVHLLAAPRELDLLTWVARWKSFTTNAAWRAGHRGALWQPGLWDRVVRNDRDYEAIGEYLANNPVAAGLVEDPGDWPYTAFWDR